MIGKVSSPHASPISSKDSFKQPSQNQQPDSSSVTIERHSIIISKNPTLPSAKLLLRQINTALIRAGRDSSQKELSKAKNLINHLDNTQQYRLTIGDRINLEKCGKFADELGSRFKTINE